MKRVLGILGALALVVLTLGLVFFLGMRAKNPTVQTAVRRTNKALFNPKQMQTAGSPGAYAAVVHHVGRSSGLPYETPIGAEPTGDGFVVALPYGSTSDWVRNVLAAGNATIVHQGASFPVDRPELVPMEEANHWFPESDQRGHRLFRIEYALRLYLAGASAPAGGGR